MSIYRTYKRKLILNKTQLERLESWMGACRVIYNMGLEISIAARNSCLKQPSRFTIERDLVDVRREYDWLKDLPYECAALTLQRLELSFKKFFTGGGFPKWASKRKWRSIGFRTNNGITSRSIRLPKIGTLKMVKDAEIVGIPKTCRIVQEAAGYFICIQCELPDPEPRCDNQAIGVDMGIANFCTLSNGTFVGNPRYFKKYEQRLRIENRSLARKKKGSNSWKKQLRRLVKLQYRVANIRKDFLHKETTKIAKGYSHVYLEGLKISNMAKNTSLSKHILDAGWGIFKELLSYKTSVELVRSQYSSQDCNVCGKIDSNNRKSQSEFECVSCGHKDHADVNAALNILGRGATLNRERKAIA